MLINDRLNYQDHELIDLSIVSCLLPAVVGLGLEAPVEVGGESGEALGVKVGHYDGGDVLLQRLQLGQGRAQQVTDEGIGTVNSDFVLTGIFEIWHVCSATTRFGDICFKFPPHSIYAYGKVLNLMQWFIFILPNQRMNYIILRQGF